MSGSEIGNDTLQLWTNLATLVMALASLLTVLEMRWQRHSGYLPDLVVSGSPFCFFVIGGHRLQLVLSTDSPPDIPKLGPASATGFIKCTNIGVGQAKQLEFKWTFDPHEIVEAIAKIDTQRARWILIDSTSISFGQRDAGLPECSHYFRYQLTITASSLNAGETVLLALPPVYAHLLAEYFAALAQSPAENKASPPFKPIKLAVSYRDIARRRHALLVSVALNLIAVAGWQANVTPVGGQRAVDGLLEITEA